MCEGEPLTLITLHSNVGPMFAGTISSFNYIFYFKKMTLWMLHLYI